MKILFIKWNTGCGTPGVAGLRVMSYAHVLTIIFCGKINK